MISSHEFFRSYPRHKLVGLLAGPAVALALVQADPGDGLSGSALITAAIALWMAIWWMTEALPLAVTALLPLASFPLLGIRGFLATVESYAHPLILLFLGGFLLARAMSARGLDRRLATTVLRAVGAHPRRIVGGIMGVTAFLSMWISNTATAMVMLPIGLSVAQAFDTKECGDTGNLSKAVLLGVAYAATIGGMGTLIGTPPNALFAAYMEETAGISVGFGWWMLIGVPIVLVLLPVAWAVITCFTCRVSRTPSPGLTDQLFAPDPARARMPVAERRLGLILVAVAACWLTRPVIEKLLPDLPISDAGIALAGALALFIVPSGSGTPRFLLSGREALGIRWSVLVLFGGGLALATAIGDTGLADWIGLQLGILQALPLFVLLLVVGTVVVFVGELASNTAMAAVLLPVAAATAQSMGEPILYLVLPVTLFATLGFMLPVATPPNAIVFGSGHVKLRDMLRAGAILDVLGILVVAGASLVLVRIVSG